MCGPIASLSPETTGAAGLLQGHRRSQCRAGIGCQWSWCFVHNHDRFNHVCLSMCLSRCWALCQAHDLLRPSKGQRWLCLQDTRHTEETAGRREAMQQRHAAGGGESRFLPGEPGCRASLSTLTPAAGSGPGSLEGEAPGFRTIPGVLGRCAVLGQGRGVVRGWWRGVSAPWRATCSLSGVCRAQPGSLDLNQGTSEPSASGLQMLCSLEPSGHCLHPPFLHSRAYSIRWLLFVFVNPF